MYLLAGSEKCDGSEADDFVVLFVDLDDLEAIAGVVASVDVGRKESDAASWGFKNFDVNDVANLARNIEEGWL
jgi:hypothetical protein